MELARRHLAPPRRGIEIGASAMKTFPGVRSWNLNYPGSEYYDRDVQALFGLPPVPVHVFGDALRMPLPDGALDYVLSAHVIEHMPDALRALREMDRVVRPGGTLFLMVPHRDRTFDAPRPRTPLQHHLADWALRTTVASEPLAPLNHYHVWITQDFLALIDFMNAVRLVHWEIADVEDVDSIHGDGFTVVARKVAHLPEPPPADARAPVAFHQLVLDLPFQVSARTIDRIVPGARLPDAPDVPRGTWRAVPVHAGFPPVAGRPFRVEVGAPVSLPVVERVRLEPARMVVEGRHLTETSWIEVRLPGGACIRILPEHEEGRLVVARPPDAPSPRGAELRVVTPAPGGGTSAPFALE